MREEFCVSGHPYYNNEDFVEGTKDGLRVIIVQIFNRFVKVTKIFLFMSYPVTFLGLVIFHISKKIEKGKELNKAITSISVLQYILLIISFVKEVFVIIQPY